VVRAAVLLVAVLATTTATTARSGFAEPRSAPAGSAEVDARSGFAGPRSAPAESAEVDAASAEPWHRGRHGKNRIVHLSITTVGLVAYPLMKPVEAALAPDACRWCTPTALDTAVRERLRWSDTGTADTLGVVAHGAAPALSIALLLLGTLDEPSWAQLIDDVVPVVETVVITQWVTRALKLGVGRQRPYARYGDPDDDDDNLSFPSGHAARPVSIVVAAALVARARRYRSEPYLWAGGLALAAASGYLRIAGDRHYVTDVLAGSALGVAAGLTVPLLMKRDLTLVPAGSGVSVAGHW
jgi:membrane-associated phospholipid phosphatase